ncbi:MAG: hypothetical protein AW10_03284 [Candidatus Accumulibacter appositus]|uniref:Uncharacterized protein n=1 Tax=Candidatus Accumulibacter appositus TaxID=1454003 RepID=A0A011PMW2_9PROT|nr:hypothetical protein [Accumulibacter sp.]EXI78200.1 MAG: hypothetical protein AW10_03284 [Candidatus Accumulibacter appositus]HRF04673.1 hypothetical protein [Accumulibacter sp.]
MGESIVKWHELPVLIRDSWSQESPLSRPYTLTPFVYPKTTLVVRSENIGHLSMAPVMAMARAGITHADKEVPESLLSPEWLQKRALPVRSSR